MTTFDRPAAIRRALRDLVAGRGFRGASMSAIAESAGVATGTAYVHYASKKELVLATYPSSRSHPVTPPHIKWWQRRGTGSRWTCCTCSQLALR